MALGWLQSIKGSFTNAMAYDLLKANVESMERENATLGTHIDLLKSQAEILSANLAEVKTQRDDLGKRLSMLEAQAAQLGEENARLRKRDEFTVLEGLAFKRGANGGEYQKEPYCPQCFRYINKSEHGLGYECPDCGYKTRTSWFISHLLDVLHGKKPLRPYEPNNEPHD